MENTQRREDAALPERPAGLSRGRGVPHDWYVDPADAGAWQEPDALEDLATAFLAAHEGTAGTDADGLGGTGLDGAGTPVATVTPLRPRTPETLQPTDLLSSAETPQTAEGAEPEPTRPGLDWAPLPGVTVEPVEGELAWQVDALCAQTDPEAFFPEKGGSTRDAKRVCAACTVRAECLDYAMANDERFGIWGGLSERERRRLRRGH
ncbi:WhiB family transcriptional regulator [Micrococcus sp.]|uniref:WhiB family transcriptional regulator n=1 Tax=Micrococcus sp. TaxID=1271 RepID=UPI002A920BBE|nr:WhiB family transcriptional regulator [Micrococcus sp.]MDY6055342.1 WhiB family transcriptional regulator [Micrococcus sp.]